LALTAALVPLTACAHDRSALDFPTVTERPDEPRRPPAVPLDPTSTLPRAEQSATAEQGIVVLIEPVGHVGVVELLDRLFDAIRNESLEQLDGVLTSDASFHSGPHGGTQSARSLWRTRFAQLNYGDMGEQSPFLPHEIELMSWKQAQALEGIRAAPIPLGTGELAVRFPIRAATLGTRQLFGNEMILRLQRVDDGYQIASMVEDFRLP
jgi:hypothetical protein